jgi:hypothetical protein
MRAIWILVVVASALLAPLAASRAAAWADAAVWPPPPIRAEAGATHESRPDAALSARVPEGAFDGLENDEYRTLLLTLDDGREANHPTVADVREPEGPIGARVPTRVAQIFRGDVRSGTLRQVEGLATATEAAWPVGGQDGDGISWKTAADGQENKNLVGIKIKNLQLGMTIQQFLSKASENFPIILNSPIFGNSIAPSFDISNIEEYYIVTKSYADKFKNLDQLSETTFMSYINSNTIVSSVTFKDDELIRFELTGDSFIDLFNISNRPAIDFLIEFSNAYGLDLTYQQDEYIVDFYVQHTKLWSFSAAVYDNKVISIELYRTGYDDTDLGPPTFD